MDTGELKALEQVLHALDAILEELRRIRVLLAE